MDEVMSAAITRFSREIGASNVIHGEALNSRDWGYCKQSYSAGILLLPRSTEEVARVCELAGIMGLSIVPHGGLTGLVDGTASTTGQVCISFERMNQILDIDPDQGIAVVEPGVVLQDLFDATAPYGLMPGIDIPSRGSCTLGGLVSTNAGGVRVIRYGMMRENVLGLEVVLGSGEVIDATNRLMKNNAGYDMKQLFIGSEGTLGLVTRIILRLHPIPQSTACALVASNGLTSMMTLLRRARLSLDAQLLSFEVMWPEYYALTIAQPGMGAAPIDPGFALYAVIEVSGRTDEDSAKALTGVLETAFESELLVDAVLAKSETQRKNIWRIREDSDAIETTCHAYLSYDVGMQLKHMPAYVERFLARFKALCPGRTPYIFGHMGDGNLHIMFAVTPEEYCDRKPFDDTVFDSLSSFESTTISAEHGIGSAKRSYLASSRSASYIHTMQRMKTVLDPGNILNPGKVL